MEWPQVYRLSDVPRSISWAEVERVLAGVDRRTPCGKRDYAILLLLVTYGLRGREIAALTLDDIDWKRERLAVPERKAGHSTAFPLSTVVGAALVDYLRHGSTGQQRPARVLPHRWRRSQPIEAAAVCSRARHYLLKAGVEVPRPGSHTLRHTCVQRLVDADFAVEDDRRFRRPPLAAHRPRSTARSPSSRCVGSPSATARRCCDDREPGAAVVDRFLAHKRALGRKYHSEEAELRLLVRFAEQHHADRLDQLTPTLLDDFLASRPRSRPRSFNHLLGVVRGLLDWAVT